MKEFRPKRELVVLVMVIICLISTPALLADSLDDSPEQISNYGISLSLSIVPIVSGEIIESELPNTEFKEAFDTGYGGRVEIFYIKDNYKFEIGAIYNQWRGQSFRSKEFPDGVEFDDFIMAGPYFGFKRNFFKDNSLRPYCLLNLGVVVLSSVDSTVRGNKTRIWDQSYREFVDFGVGLEYDFTKKMSFYLDFRLEHFG